MNIIPRPRFNEAYCIPHHSYNPLCDYIVDDDYDDDYGDYDQDDYDQDSFGYYDDNY